MYILVPPLLTPFGYPYYYGGSSGIFFLFFPAYFLAVAGMILGPYFALAGIIAKNKSVWVEVNRMLHTHISMPIVGGLALFYGSFWGYAFVFFVLPVYAMFIFLATLITVMASRTGRASTGTPANAPGSTQPSP